MPRQAVPLRNKAAPSVLEQTPYPLLSPVLRVKKKNSSKSAPVMISLTLVSGFSHRSSSCLIWDSASRLVKRSISRRWASLSCRIKSFASPYVKADPSSAISSAVQPRSLSVLARSATAPSAPRSLDGRNILSFFRMLPDALVNRIAGLTFRECIVTRKASNQRKFLFLLRRWFRTHSPYSRISFKAVH